MKRLSTQEDTERIAKKFAEIGESIYGHYRKGMMSMFPKPLSKELIDEEIFSIITESESKGQAGLNAILIKENLTKAGINLTYDAVTKYLHELTKKCKITRRIRGKPWRYFYYSSNYCSQIKGMDEFEE